MPVKFSAPEYTQLLFVHAVAVQQGLRFAEETFIPHISVPNNEQHS
jgi:hypothetical protein